MVLSPIIQNEEGSHLSVFETIKRAGFLRIRVDGEIITINNIPDLDDGKKHSIDIVIDRLIKVNKEFGKKVKVVVTLKK